jgi:hypothetical protein
MEKQNGVSSEGIPFVGLFEMHNDAPTGENLFQMKLHERFNIGEYIITRVPGGWMYKYSSGDLAVFVPLNNEFCRRGV